MAVEEKFFPLADLSTMASRPIVYQLADCYGCGEVCLNVEWTGLDRFDGSIHLVEKHHGDITNWTAIQKLKHDMTTANGATILYDRTFCSRIVGIYVDPGTCSYGVLNAYLKAR